MRALERHETPRHFAHDLWSVTAWPQPVPRNPRTLLVAVATVGGERVDGNFEEAEAFLLYEKDGPHTCYIGRQPCPLTAAGESPLKRSWLLSECDLVLCSNISDNCRYTLSALGVECDLAYSGANVSEAVAAL